MEFNYLNELPNVEFWGERNAYIDDLKEWEKTDSKVIKFACKNASEKGSCRSSITAYIKKFNKDYTVFSEKGRYNIYVVRA